MKRTIGAWLLTMCLLLAATPSHAAITPVVQKPLAQTEEDILARVAAIKGESAPQRSSFNDAGDEWETGGDEDVQRSYGPGNYQVQIIAANTIGWGSAPAAAADFYAEVDAYHVDGPLDNEFGILFRSDGEQYYVYNVSSDGFYRLHKWLGGQWVSVVDWTASSAIVTGENSHNRLGILAEGPTISLLANDAVLATVADESIGGTGLALAVGSFAEGGVQIAFDDFTLWALDDEALDEPVPATPTEPATPTVAVTPQPREEGRTTLDPELVQTVVEPIRGNTPTYLDDFRRADDRWPTVEDETGRIAFANRGLKVQVEQPDVALWTSNQEIAALGAGDLFVEVDARREAGAFDSTHGLLVRFVDNDNYYYFGVSAAGTYSFWRVVAGEWTKLVDWTPSAAIDTAQGATNRLAVLAQGDRFLLLVNDTPLAEASDGAFAAGGIGLYAGVYAEAGLDVTFDNLAVWVLSEAEARPPVDSTALQEAQAQADETRGGDPTYHARFSRDDGAWSLGDDDSATIAVGRGGLTIQVHRPEWLAWSTNGAQVEDFQVEVDLTLADAAVPAEAGLVFRQQDDSNFYFYAIDNTGRYSLWKKQGGEWQSLSPWARSDALDTGDGAENRIGLLVQGEQTALILNGQVVATVEDDSFPSGSLALAVGSFAQEGIAATFDNLSLWNLEAP